MITKAWLNILWQERFPVLTLPDSFVEFWLRLGNNKAEVVYVFDQVKKFFVEEEKTKTAEDWARIISSMLKKAAQRSPNYRG